MSAKTLQYKYMKKYLTLTLIAIFLAEASTIWAMHPARKKGKRRTVLIEDPSSSTMRRRQQELLERIEQLRASNTQLAKKIQDEKGYQQALFQRAQRATFRALPNANGPINTYTGTIFQVNHQGTKEVFGAIAAHALQTGEEPGLLNKNFTALFVHEGELRTLPATVVGLTPSLMGDVALVKFPSKYESLFEPLPLTEQTSISFPAQGYAQGFACNILSRQTFPITGQTSNGTLISKLPATEVGNRAGFCGTAVFGKDFEWLGIHIGSSYEEQIGYIAPVSTIRMLVDAYHNPRALHLVHIVGNKFVNLFGNEYVARTELLDSKGTLLWDHYTRSKFSAVQIEQVLEKYPQTSSVRITLRRMMWKGILSSKEILEKSHSSRVVTIALTDNLE